MRHSSVLNLYVMKSFDIVLIVIALVLLVVLLPELPSFPGLGLFGMLIKIASLALLMLFVFYWKFAQYKGSMSESWSKLIERGEKIFIPVLTWLDTKVSKITLGPKLVTSKSPLIIVVVLSALLFIL